MSTAKMLDGTVVDVVPMTGFETRIVQHPPGVVMEIARRLRIPGFGIDTRYVGDEVVTELTATPHDFDRITAEM